MPRSLVSIVFALTLVACSRAGVDEDAGPPAGTPVAWVDDEVVLVEELRLGAQRDAEAQRAALDAAILGRLAVLEARDRGLGQRPGVTRRVEAIRRRAQAEEREVLRNALRVHVASSVRISDAELREYFSAHPDRFRQPTYTVRRAPFDSRAEAEAAVVSRDPLAEDLGPAPLSSFSPDLQAALAGLRRPGGRTAVQSEGRWWAVELVASELSAPSSFDSVRDNVAQVVRRERARAALKRMLDERRSEVEIRVDEAVLESLGSDAQEPDS